MDKVKTNDFRGVSDNAEGGFSGMSKHPAFVPILVIIPIKDLNEQNSSLSQN